MHLDGRQIEEIVLTAAQTVMGVTLLLGLRFQRWAAWTLLGLFLVGAAMMAVGMFVSSLTESVVVAALVTFVILLVLWIMNWQAGRLAGNARDVLDYISMPSHLDAFAKGAPALKDLLYFASFMILGPYFTERAIEAQRWA